MSIPRVMNTGKIQGATRQDQREMEVAQKLVSAGIISSVQEFLNTPEALKHLKIEEYNKSHPNDPIGNKGARGEINRQETKSTEDSKGTEMSKFMKDIDWKKLKLQ